MRASLIAIDAKYPHTNIAVRSIALYARERGVEHAAIAEYSINQWPDYILARLYELDSEVYLFSCYIWNIELVRQLAAELRKIRPDASIWAGGPEVSYHSAAFLADNPAFDLVVRGEGEETVTRLLQGQLEIPGTVFRRKGEILEMPEAAPPDLDALPFPYDDIPSLEGRVLYYESMRGCPFGCSYCLSSIRRGVRYRRLELVFADLQRFLNARVKRVKFVDRTFNCDKKRALAIWRFLREQDNGVTNFHFEMAGELLDGECVDFLSTTRPGLFQFEIGVQSTHPQTLREIDRPADLELLFRRVRQLSAPGNIHLHLDLIAGLPHEDYSIFAHSFNQVYALRPEQFQLGFLKVLKGSAMERKAGEYRLVYRDSAPYQVLSTRWLSFAELERLSLVEDLVERYYNSGRFRHLLEYLIPHFPSPFSFYEALADYWKSRELHRAPIDKITQYQVLGEFAAHSGISPGDAMKSLCRFDLALHEKIKKLPPWAESPEPDNLRQAATTFYRNPGHLSRFLPGIADSKQAARHTSIEYFAVDPLEEGQSSVYYLFDYTKRSISGHAMCQKISREYLFPEEANVK